VKGWRRRVLVLAVAASASSFASTAHAQTTTPTDGKHPYVGIGSSFTAFHAECCDREADGEHKGAALVLDGGVTLQRRLDLGARLIWTPAKDDGGDTLNSTALLVVAKYRFWPSRGFFVSGGAGMAWMTNALALIDEPSPPARAKGLSVELAAGWEWRLHRHFGIQAFGSQHVIGLGDLPTQIPGESLDNLIINYWSAGASIVIR
jgi:hypothetical protein